MANGMLGRRGHPQLNRNGELKHLLTVEGLPRAVLAFVERAWPRLRRAIELDLTFEALPPKGCTRCLDLERALSELTPQFVASAATGGIQ